MLPLPLLADQYLRDTKVPSGESGHCDNKPFVKLPALYSIMTLNVHRVAGSLEARLTRESFSF